MIRLGTAFRRDHSAALSQASSVTSSLLSMGKNKLAAPNLNSFSPFEGNPVMNLARGVSPNTSPVNQAIGTGMPSWGLLR